MIRKKAEYLLKQSSIYKHNYDLIFHTGTCTCVTVVPHAASHCSSQLIKCFLAKLHSLQILWILLNWKTNVPRIRPVSDSSLLRFFLFFKVQV